MMRKGEEFSIGDHPSSVMQILREAAKLLWRSWKPILSVFLTLLLPYTLLFLTTHLYVTTSTAHMKSEFVVMRTMDNSSTEYSLLLAAVIKDLRRITRAEVVYVPTSHLLSFLLLMGTMYTVAMAKKGKQVTLKDVLSRMGRTWKGVVATQLYVYVITFGYMATLVVLVGVFAFISDGSRAVVGLTAVMAVLALLLLVYLQMVWYQGLVVSVVEEDASGLAALGRAAELVQGRRILGFRVNLHLQVITGAFLVVYYSVSALLTRGETTHLVSGLLMFYARLGLRAFMVAVYVVFYYECKKGHGEEIAMKESTVYTRVPTLDGALLP